jgi:hypothetical protein
MNLLLVLAGKIGTVTLRPSVLLLESVAMFHRVVSSMVSASILSMILMKANLGPCSSKPVPTTTGPLPLAPLSRLPLGPEVALAELDEPRELVPLVPSLPGLSYLPGHEDGPLVGDAGRLICGEDGDSPFLGSDQSDEPEPDAKGSPGALHDGAGGDRSMVGAVCTLVKVSGSLSGSIAAIAPGAVKPLGPSAGKEAIPASVLGEEHLVEFEPTCHFSIAFAPHGFSPPFSAIDYREGV